MVVDAMWNIKFLLWRCSICKYNLVGFARNCFASINCFCTDKEKDDVSLHCKRLAVALNCDTIKVCLKEKDVPSEFLLVGIDKYLVIDVKADPFFIFVKRQMKLWLELMHLIGAKFLPEKKLWLNLYF